jgi:hypothetical protein
MARVAAIMSMSLDGYVADSRDGVRRPGPPLPNTRVTARFPQAI